MTHRPGALSKIRTLARKLAKEEEARERQHAIARSLANKGSGGDTEIAHLTLGEIVVPQALQSPEVMAALRAAAEAHGLPFDILRVGDRHNHINPETGAPEFGVVDWFSNLFQGKSNTAGAASPPQPTTLLDYAPMVPNVNAPNAAAPSYKDLDFNPDGPDKWLVGLKHPFAAIRGGLDALTAKKDVKEIYGPNPQNDEGDAYRHARWNQLMTQSIGPEKAKMLGDAWERTNRDGPLGSRLMDLYNNQVGRTLPADSSDPQSVLQNAIKQGYLRTRPFKQ